MTPSRDLSEFREMARKFMGSYGKWTIHYTTKDREYEVGVLTTLLLEVSSAAAERAAKKVDTLSASHALTAIANGNRQSIAECYMDASRAADECAKDIRADGGRGE